MSTLKRAHWRSRKDLPVLLHQGVLFLEMRRRLELGRVSIGARLPVLCDFVLVRLVPGLDGLLQIRDRLVPARSLHSVRARVGVDADPAGVLLGATSALSDLTLLQSSGRIGPPCPQVQGAPARSSF